MINFFKNLFFLIVFLCFFTLKNYAQCQNENTTFSNGEKVSFEVYYNWGFFWFNAGEVFFKTDSIVQNNVSLYHFISKGGTHKAYDWIFKVRDTYESYIEANTFKPLLGKRDSYEGGHEVKERYQFNYKNMQIFSQLEIPDKPIKRDTFSFSPCTFDVLAATYYARNIDFSRCKAGDKIPIDIIIDNQVYKLYIKYIGKEIAKHKDGSKYRCIKFKAKVIEGSIFKGGEDLTVWVSDDDNKVPIIVEAKILVGSIKAYINEMKNLRHPFTAKIDSK